MTDARPFDFEAKHGSEHEQLVRKVIPGYEALFAMARAILQAQVKKQANLLVAGAGGGMELVSLGRDNPGWNLTAVDPSTNMLNGARQRVAEAGLEKQVQFHQGYVHQLPDDTPFDGATCILVTHLLPDDGAKLKLLSDISKRLKPGAPLILADPFGDLETVPLKDYISPWRFFQLHHGRSEAEIDQLFEQIREAVFMVSEARMMELLHEAGFGDAFRFYTAFWYGGWATSKQ